MWFTRADILLSFHNMRRVAYQLTAALLLLEFPIITTAVTQSRDEPVFFPLTLAAWVLSSSIYFYDSLSKEKRKLSLSLTIWMKIVWLLKRRRKKNNRARHVHIVVPNFDDVFQLCGLEYVFHVCMFIYFYCFSWVVFSAHIAHYLFCTVFIVIAYADTISNEIERQ